MSKLKILTGLMLLTASLHAYALTCNQTNLNYPFRQVVLGLDGGLRCDYGEEFDFNHSYELEGTFKPASGNWEGASDPYTVYCKSPQASSCVFYKIR